MVGGGGVLARAVLAVLICALFPTGAGAAPLWKFEFEELKGTESIAGAAAQGTLSGVLGLTTTCDLSYGMEVFNSGGNAKGSVTSMAFENCVTDDAACTVEEAAAEALPWSVSGSVVSFVRYVVFKGVKFTIVYGGLECPLEGVEAGFTGTAGGKYDNGTGAFAFNPTNFKATGTEIKVFGNSAQWEAFFTTEALGFHNGQVLELS